jgi:hypothetical protein
MPWHFSLKTDFSVFLYIFRSMFLNSFISTSNMFCFFQQAGSSDSELALSDSDFELTMMNPKMEMQIVGRVINRSYGSILPTSLIYIVLSTRGCSPWRPAETQRMHVNCDKHKKILQFQTLHVDRYHHQQFDCALCHVHEYQW